jgi:hypothetical protein
VPSKLFVTWATVPPVRVTTVYRLQYHTVPLETVTLYFLELAWIVMGVR